jgi:hypothetical protein
MGHISFWPVQIMLIFWEKTQIPYSHVDGVWIPYCFEACRIISPPFYPASSAAASDVVFHPAFCVVNGLDWVTPTEKKRSKFKHRTYNR